MDKTKLKYAIDLGLVVTFILSLGTGLVKLPLVRNAFYLTGGVLPYHEITFVHDLAGPLMGLLILLHLALNFSWLVAMTKKYLGKGEA